jgi:hypothetical protein
MVRGPGTGTSDSIQARLSHGEYVLPADTVAAVGQQALDELRAATHTPVQRYADGGVVQDDQQPMQGAVTRVGNSYSGSNVSGDVSINGQQPGGTFSQIASARPNMPIAPASTSQPGQPSPAAAPPASATSPPVSGATAAPMDWSQRNARRNLEVTASSLMPSKAREDAQTQLAGPAVAPAPVVGAPPTGQPSASGRAPVAPAYVPDVTPPPRRSPVRNVMDSMNLSMPGFADGGIVDEQAQRRAAALMGQIPTDGYPQAPAADGSQRNPMNSDVGRNLSALPSVGAIPGAALRGTGLVARAFGAAQPAMSGVGQAAQAAAPYAPVVAGGAALAGAANADSPASPGRTPTTRQSNPLVAAAMAQQASAAGVPGSPGAAAAPIPGPAAHPGPTNIMRDGNSYSGPANIGGNITINGQPPGGTMNSLPAGAVPSTQTPGIAPGLSSSLGNPLVQAAIAHSGNDWASRNALRNAEVSASSIKNTQQWGGRGAENNPAVQKYQAMLTTDQALQQAAPGLQAEGMRQGNALVRAAMEQQGQNQRAGMQAGLTQQRLDMDRETQGYTNRTNRLVEAARNQVAQQQDPTKRRSLVQYMRDIEGATQQSDPYLVVPGGQQVDPTSGRAYNTPSTVFNRSTGQFMQQPGQGGPISVTNQAQFNALPSGTLYTAPDGQQYRKN